MKNVTISDLEVQVVMYVFRTNYQGKSNAVVRKDLLPEIRKAANYDMSDRQFRHIVAHIREQDIMSPFFIVSSVSHGYWLTDDQDEQNEFILQELNRMAHQYDNVKNLHIRLKTGRTKIKEEQPSLFA